MIANVDKVIDWLETNHLEHWTVLTKEGDNNKVFETTEDESLTDRIARFRRVMDFCAGNRFLIKAKRDAKAGRGMYSEEFRNNIESPAGSVQSATIGAVASPGVGFISVDELEKRLHKERENIMKDVKIERLEAELKEAKEEISASNTTFNNVMKRAEPYIGTVLGSIVGKIIPPTTQLGVAGTETSTSIDEIESFEVTDQERLESALKRFAAAEPDFVKIIETLADMAEKKDPMYNLAKAQLFK